MVMIIGLPGVLIWRYGTAVGARATYSGVKDEISGAKARFLINKFVGLLT